MEGNKTVFDTNIWVSYFIKGNFTELVRLVFDKNVHFFRSKELTEELTIVLSRTKFKKYLTLDVSEYISFYEELSELKRTVSEFDACKDPKDNFLFDLAIQSHADYLVSGDADVRSTKIDIKGLKVLSLTAFKEII